MTSIQARKQRKILYQAPLHKKRKWIASHLEENLLLKYDRRSIPVVKGDTVKVMRGSYKGHEDKVAFVRVKKQIIEIEGLTMAKADGNKIPRPIHPSNVLITKLNLTDQWRREILQRGVSEETKKAIEKEAQQQIKAQEEEEERQAAELKKQEEEEKKAAEEAEQTRKEATESLEQKETSAETVKESKQEQPSEQESTDKQKPKAASPKKTEPSAPSTSSKETKKVSSGKKTTAKKPSAKEEKA